MTTQPEALRLADELETDWHYKRAEHPMLDAAAELRRLHAINGELLKALEEISTHSVCRDARHIADKAILKATGEQK